LLFDNDKLTLGKKVTILAQWADNYDAITDNGKKSGFSTIEESAQASRKPRGDMPIMTLMHKPFIIAKPPGTEFCSGCSDYRPVSYFYPDEDSATGYYKYCSGCCRGFAKQYYAAHKEAVKAKRNARYAAKVMSEQGREVRPYKRRWQNPPLIDAEAA
jgi:hypothetical protein